jgi:hypothetical protein
MKVGHKDSRSFAEACLKLKSSVFWDIMPEQSKKIELFIATAMRTSNPIYLKLFNPKNV